MITNKEYQYTLKIKYENIRNEITFMPLGTVMTPVFYRETQSILTKRYKTEEDIINEINEIKA